jgi:hypothetical protein
LNNSCLDQAVFETIAPDDNRNLNSYETDLCLKREFAGFNDISQGIEVTIPGN